MIIFYCHGKKSKRCKRCQRHIKGKWRWRLFLSPCIYEEYGCIDFIEKEEV